MYSLFAMLDYFKTFVCINCLPGTLTMHPLSVEQGHRTILELYNFLSQQYKYLSSLYFLQNLFYSFSILQ